MLGKRDSAKNKEAYDILFRHKTEIEETVGAELHWDKAEGLTSSWINYRLDGVGIRNEEDLDKAMIFSNLDKALEQTLEFERKLGSGL